MIASISPPVPMLALRRTWHVLFRSGAVEPTVVRQATAAAGIVQPFPNIVEG
jgi:hypothetical protein